MREKRLSILGSLHSHSSTGTLRFTPVTFAAIGYTIGTSSAWVCVNRALPRAVARTKVKQWSPSPTLRTQFITNDRAIWRVHTDTRMVTDSDDGWLPR